MSNFLTLCAVQWAVFETICFLKKKREGKQTFSYDLYKFNFELANK